jgi:aminomethyltransferase
MLKRTPLFDVHNKFSAKIVPFAGYEMPIQYPSGIVTEHNWVRENAGLFDVSHMGQILIEGEGASEFISRITPSDFSTTAEDVAKYTVLTNENGGIIDDLIITKLSPQSFFAVINAGCKDKDIAWIQKNLPQNLTLKVLDDRALIALQGPKAEAALEKLLKLKLGNLGYMTLMFAGYKGKNIFISRLGYTGEDGFEISVPNDLAADLFEALCADETVKPIGLGARDSLRLEMGYPLYGHDIDDTTSPVEGNLSWVIAKANTGFIGAERVLNEKQNGASRKRVGIKIIDKTIAREGAEIFSADNKKIGVVTSGTFSPTLKAAIAQGYVDSANAAIGTKIFVNVRGNNFAAEVAPVNFLNPKTKAIKKAA